MKITEAGYYPNLEMHTYLSDPCPEPSLSKGTVADIYYRSPLHARHNHPRFSGKAIDATPGQDKGSAVHALVCGGYPLVYCDALNPRGTIATDWKTKAAQEFADQAVAANQIPLLDKDRESVNAAADNVRELLAKRFTSPTYEQSMFVKVDGVWCRGRADILATDIADGRDTDIDLKMCENADGQTWVRQNVKTARYDIQASLREIGHRTLGHPKKMAWLLCEFVAPYAVSLVWPTAKMLAVAEAKIHHAAKTWRDCLDSDVWPGYKDYSAEVAGYEEFELAERIGVVP